MTRPIGIIAVKKDPPDLDRFVAALLAFTIRELEAERAATAAAEAEPRGEEARG